MQIDRPAPGNPFHTSAPLYGKSRPAYPPQVIDALLASIAHPASAPIRVADIGAGTGKLTLMLAQRGTIVHAVEPSEAMLAQMPASPRVSAHIASAENTRLPESSVDLVTYAQSWHWVDAEAAGAEAARITTSAGVLAIIWNQMDVSIPWVHRLSRIMRSGDVHRPDQPPSLPAPWSSPVLKREDWSALTTPEDLLELGTTRSSYLRQDEDGRMRMRKNLEWYLYEHLSFAPHQPLRLPYMTLTWTSTKITPR